jgi:hypothetical protein
LTSTSPKQFILSGSKARIGAITAAIVLLLIVLGVLLITASGSSTESTSIITPLPNVTALDSLLYLQQAGVQIMAQQALEIEKAQWAAEQGYRFRIADAPTRTELLMLSYASPDLAGRDLITLLNTGEYASWQIIQMANLLVILPSDIIPALATEIGSHLTQYVLAPYRDFLPTSTPMM